MSQANLEPKTIEDYRDIVKILKLKVMKQMKYIQQLQQKVRFYETQDLKGSAKDARFEMQAAAKRDSPIAKDFQYNNLKNKSIVMYLFQKGARKLGINLEGLFRYADVDYKNEIDSDFFRNMLSKMNLGLTLKQVSCLIFIFDQDCTGVITKSEYFSSLEAYQVCDEKNSKKYTQQCLMKLSELFEQKRMDPQTFYNQYSKGQLKLDLNSFEEALKKSFGKTLQDRQIIGAFNQIDFQSQGFIQKNSFIYSLKAYISKMKSVNAESRVIPDSTNKKNIGQSYLKPKDSNNNSGSRFITPKGPTESNSRVKQSSKSTVTIRQDKALDNVKSNNDENLAESAKSGAMTLQEVLADLEKQNVTLKGLYPSILELDFDRPITLQQFSRIIRQLAQGAKHMTISHLFRLMDRDQRGTIHFSQLLEFFIKVDGDIDTIFRIIARSFELDGLNTQKFFFINELTDQDEINQEQFDSILSSKYGIQKDIFTPVWKYFDKQGTNKVKISTIIKELSTYETQ